MSVESKAPIVRAVFMGTPDFAVPSLVALRELSDVVAVYTRPDKPSGRGQKMEPSPVKIYAGSAGIQTCQPKSLRSSETYDAIRALAPEVILVAAYGLILPDRVLSLPKHGCINVHPSLLPTHRGASPIAAAILRGDNSTGVTLMRMDAGLDTGPIIAQREVEIRDDDTGGTLERRLSLTAADLVRVTLPAWIAGQLLATPQADNAATVTRMLRKEDGLINWNNAAVEISRKVRAYQPWPGASTTWKGRVLKIVKARAIERSAESGVVASVDHKTVVGTGAGSLELEVIQLAGKRPMTAEEFARGQRDFVGSRLGGG